MAVEDFSIWAFLGDKAIDVGVGVGATFVGVLLIYAVTGPRVIFGDSVRVSRRRDGRDRFRILINNRSRVQPIVEMQVFARLELSNGLRKTSIPVPLSRDLYYNVVRPQNPAGWWVTTRLDLADVDWKRYLPPDFPRPSRPRDLHLTLLQLDARLSVTARTVSSIFGTTRVHQRYYGPEDIEIARDSFEGAQRVRLLDRVRDYLLTARPRGVSVPRRSSR